MGAGEGFAGEFVERAGEALGDAAVVDEDERRVLLADDFEKPGMDGAPDGGALGALGGGTLGGSSISPRRAMSSTGTST